MTTLDPSFRGSVGTTVADSVPWWPEPTTTPRRNLVVVILDDTGWSDLGCFGSEIATPHIDALAHNGVRYSNFHVTPLCSPTRASFLTGKNNHAVGMRFLADTDTGFPNSRGSVRAGTPVLPQVLREQGYGTYLVGKWHLAPLHEITPAGPHGNWPLALGFDRYYGFLDGCTDQYEPELYEDNHAVPTPTRDGYHLSEDLVDRSISYLRDHLSFRPNDPFYLQVAFGATHAPFQAPRAFIDKYLDEFAKGWDQTRRERLARQILTGVVPSGTPLTERNEGVSAWEELTDVEREVFTHLQSAFAGFLEHTDAQIGRLLNALEEFGQTDDTVFALFSDNGASREGGPTGDVDTNGPYSGIRRPAAAMVGELDRVGSVTGGAHYPEGWAMAGNTPFRRYKQFVDLGGVRSPLVISTPETSRAAVRTQFMHVVDLAPTLYDLIGATAPDGMDGESLAESIVDATAPVGRTTQYWETLGHRAIWHDGWRAVTAHEVGAPYADDTWRLYDTRTDFAEARDVAAEHPDVLRRLQDLWWQEAGRHDVLPLDDRPLRVLIELAGPHGLIAQDRLELRPGQSHVPGATGVTGSHRTLTVRARLAADVSALTGTILSSGNAQGGYFLSVQGGVLRFEHKLLDTHLALVGDRPIPPDAQTVGFTLHAAEDRRARVRLTIDDVPASDELVIPTSSSHLSFWGLDVGAGVVSGFSPLQTIALPAQTIALVTMDASPQEDDARERADVILASE